VKVRALVRRAFPYLVIALSGFALAYVVVFFFILPSKVIPPEVPATPHETSDTLLPVIAPMSPPQPETVVAPPISAMPPEHSLVQVPRVLGMDLNQAQILLDGAQLITVVRHDTSSFELPNTVLRQSIPAGRSVVPNDTIVITVSRFPSPSLSDSTPE
jgi:hypothetical protein